MKYCFIPARMSVVQKTENTKCLQRYTAAETLIQLWFPLYSKQFNFLKC